MKASELRDKDQDALQKELGDLLKAHFSLRMQIATQQLNVYPQAKRATSPVAVTITQPGSILRGHGLAVNLANKHYELQSQVRARYVRSPR